MIDLYVYYKVREADAAALAPRVRAMQARLGRNGAASQPAFQPNHQLNYQLKCRPETRDGLQTWMEVYPACDAGFAAAVEAAAQDAGLADFIQGPRRSEVFVDLPADLAPNHIEPNHANPEDATPCA